MDFSIIFKCLKDKKALRTFVLATVIITVVYFAFSISLSLFSTRPFPQGTIMDLILFGGLKAFSTFKAFDWIILALFPLVGGLLFANYSYWKCASKTASSGLVVGLFAATCPACILPIMGISSVVTFLTGISVYLKLGALILLVGGTYYVANKRTCPPGKCEKS